MGGGASKISQNSAKNSDFAQKSSQARTKHNKRDFAQKSSQAHGDKSDNRVAQSYNVHFFDAIDFRSAKYPQFSCHIRPFLNKLLWGRELSIGELGCFASHYSLWLRCAQSRAPIIVLEDDVVLEAHFLKSLDEIIKSDFEYVRFGGLFEVDSKHIVSHFHEPALGISGAQGYYLTPRAILNLR